MLSYLEFITDLVKNVIFYLIVSSKIVSVFLSKNIIFL